MEKPVFPPKFFEELARENPLGEYISPELAEAWWHYIAWPAYKTYNYKRHGVAVRRWWARLSQVDLARALQALSGAEVQSAQTAQNQMDETHNSWDESESDTLRVIMGGKQ